MITFKDMGLSQDLINALEQNGITAPTEIQSKSIPEALNGNDILASSQTGSGKTLAYLLPAISTIIKDKNKVLVLAPTREIAMQVSAACNSSGVALGNLWNSDQLDF